MKCSIWGSALLTWRYVVVLHAHNSCTLCMIDGRSLDAFPPLFSILYMYLSGGKNGVRQILAVSWCTSHCCAHVHLYAMSSERQDSLFQAVAVIEMWASVRIFFLENCCRENGGKCCQPCFCPLHCGSCSEHLHHTGLEIQNVVFFLYDYFCVFLCIFHSRSRGNKLIMPYVCVLFFFLFFLSSTGLQHTNASHVLYTLSIICSGNRKVMALVATSAVIGLEVLVYLFLC